MNTQTFEQATVTRIQANPTWNLEQMRLALRTLWNTKETVKSDKSVEVVQKFLLNLESNLKASKFIFFKQPQVLALYLATRDSVMTDVNFVADVIEPAMNCNYDDLNAEMHQQYQDSNDYYHNETTTQEEATPMSNNFEAPKSIYIFTDGSCNVPAKTGGWGVHISMEGSDKFKAMSGSVAGTTNNVMELQAMIEGIKAVTIKEGFIYEFATDSKYVLQSIANKDKNLANNFAKMKNEETLRELYKALDEKGIVLTELTQPVMGNNTIQSGDIVHRANANNVIFKWIKGHSDHPGNDEADRLALTARKLLDKTGKPSSEVITPKAVAEVSTEASVAPEKVLEEVKVESMEAVAEQLAVLIDTPDVVVEEEIPTKSFRDILLDIDKTPSMLERRQLEFPDVQEVYHDRNIDAWKESILASEIMLNALAYFEYKLDELEKNFTLYEDLLLDAEAEFQTNPDTFNYLQEIVKFGKWIPSLIQEEELDIINHKLSDPKTRRKFNEEFQAQCDAVDAKIKEMEKDSVSETIDQPSSVAVEAEMFEVLFEQEYTGIRFKGYSEAAYPIKTWSDCEMTYMPLKGKLPNNLIKTQDCDGLDIFFTPEQYKVWGYVFEVEVSSQPTMAASILDVQTTQEVEYGYAYYINDYMTMSNPEAIDEEIFIFVQVHPKGYVYEGELFETLEHVIQRHKQESGNSINYTEDTLRPVPAEALEEELRDFVPLKD